MLPILVDDIYFLIGLSRHGAPISLASSIRGGETVKDYIQQFCWPGTKPRKDGKINIIYVHDMPLRTLLFTIAKLTGSVKLHIANRSYIHYALECLELIMFNWAEEVLLQMKVQLTKVKSGKMNNFKNGSILITFILEQVPLM